MTLQIFAQEMQQLAKRVESNIPKMQAGVANDVVEFVAHATPQLTGQASGNWKTAIGSEDLSFTPGPSDPNISISTAKAALKSLAMGQVVHINNNTPYIIDLNQGSSAKAPAAFVELAIVSALSTSGRFNLLVS